LFGGHVLRNRRRRNEQDDRDQSLAQHLKSPITNAGPFRGFAQKRTPLKARYR
jgi:hypothetical protein